MAVARIDKDWIRCGECGHKLGRIKGNWSDVQAFPAIETKCHACKSIVYIMVGGQGKDERAGSRTEA